MFHAFSIVVTMRLQPYTLLYMHRADTLLYSIYGSTPYQVLE